MDAELCLWDEGGEDQDDDTLAMLSASATPATVNIAGLATVGDASVWLVPVSDR